MSSSSLNLQRIPKLAIEAGKKEISLSSRDKGEKEKDTAEKKRQCLWGELPEKLQEQLLERVNKQLRKERIDPLTGLPEGMTQDKLRLPVPTPGVILDFAATTAVSKAAMRLAVSKAAMRAGGGFGDKGKGKGKAKGKGGGMQIFVKTPTGNTITLDVEPSDLIIGVKALIESQEGVEVMDKSLVIWCDELMQLSELDIKDGDTLNLVDMAGHGT